MQEMKNRRFALSLESERDREELKGKNSTTVMYFGELDESILYLNYI